MFTLIFFIPICMKFLKEKEKKKRMLLKKCYIYNGVSTNHFIQTCIHFFSKYNSSYCWVSLLKF